MLISIVNKCVFSYFNPDHHESREARQTPGTGPDRWKGTFQSPNISLIIINTQEPRFTVCSSGLGHMCRGPLIKSTLATIFRRMRKPH